MTMNDSPQVHSSIPTTRSNWLDDEAGPATAPITQSSLFRWAVVGWSVAAGLLIVIALLLLSWSMQTQPTRILLDIDHQQARTLYFFRHNHVTGFFISQTFVKEKGYSKPIAWAQSSIALDSTSDRKNPLLARFDPADSEWVVWDGKRIQLEPRPEHLLHPGFFTSLWRSLSRFSE
jgi:hypothetical protein